MRVPEEHKAEIRRIISSIRCPRQFACCDPDIQEPGHIRCLVNPSLIECLRKESRTCPFGIQFGYSIFCRCPLRKYLVKNDLHGLRGQFDTGV